MQFDLFRQKTFAEELELQKRTAERWDRIDPIDLDVFDGMEGALTADHIREGKRKSCNKCPVSLAMIDMLKEHTNLGDKGLSVEAGRLYISVICEHGSRFVVLLEMSGLMQEWVNNFDDGKDVPTGTVYIEKNGFTENLEGDGKVQHWSCGIDVKE